MTIDELCTYCLEVIDLLNSKDKEKHDDKYIWRHIHETLGGQGYDVRRCLISFISNNTK